MFFPYNFRPEADSDVISGMAVDNVGMDVPIKFGDSSSNGFRDIRGADFVSNERTLVKPIQIVRNATAFRLKINSDFAHILRKDRIIKRVAPRSE